MNLFRSMRERFGNLFGAVIGSIALLGCGLLFALVFAPQQKLEARRIERLPIMDAETVTSATDGEEILITGRVEGDALPEVREFIAYALEVWNVTPADADDPDDEPNGSWEDVKTILPELKLNMGDEKVPLLSAENVTFGGALHEEIVRSSGNLSAESEGEWLADGTQRYKGLYFGDLTTVLGVKASIGGVIPDELFAGDRVTFIESQHEAAKGLLIAGVSMVVCSPVVLVGGILSAIFGRRRR
ncbi:MAG: hypothetical protein ISR58_01290 [Anaerolineales bacterium]|nr:hypothetical protein [Chloroflexota bacterium]MBL6979799.1 hypothetical protein [Anaerolineales bacterium]